MIYLHTGLLQEEQKKRQNAGSPAESYTSAESVGKLLFENEYFHPVQGINLGFKMDRHGKGMPFINPWECNL